MGSVLLYLVLSTVLEISCYNLLALENFKSLYIINTTLPDLENKTEDEFEIETKPKYIETFLGKLETINIFDYHYREQFIFYSGNNTNGLIRLSFGSKDAKRERIVKRPVILDVAVDWVQDKVYWTDSSEIHSVDLEGSNDKLVLSLSSVKDFTGLTAIESFDHIAIDPIERTLFFTVVFDDDVKRKVLFKSDLQGYYLRQLRKDHIHESVQYINLDLEKNKLYLQVLEHKQLHFYETHYDGTKILEFHSDDLNIEYPFQFFKGKLLFSSRNITEEEVHFYEGTFSSNGLLDVIRGPSSMWNTTATALRVYEQDAQLSREKFHLRKCKTMKCNYNKCSVLPVNGATCDCIGDNGLLEDMRTCHNKYIYKIFSSNVLITRNAVSNCTFKVNDTKATDYYFTKGYLFYYWPDRKAIYRQKCQVSAVKIKDNVADVLGLAVDLVHDVIYWVDLPAGQLYRSDTEGQNVYVRQFITDLAPLASENDFVLHSEYYRNNIVVDPQKEYLFAALILKNGTYLLVRSHLRNIKSHKHTTGQGHITSIAINVELQRIYFATIINTEVTVYVCNYDFGGLVSYSISNEYGTIVSISAIKHNIVRCIGYNNETGTSVLLDCTGGTKVETLQAPDKMYKMVSAFQQAPLEDLKCMEKHCSHICLKNVTCACPEDYSLYKDTTCFANVKRGNYTDDGNERRDSPQALKVMVIIAVVIIVVVVGVSVFLFPWRDDFDTDINEDMELHT